uniref:Uncharacterized protein n=1 Tax=Arundo donax TaxID=35708 RepID=A0A0A9C990_ARUDO
MQIHLEPSIQNQNLLETVVVVLITFVCEDICLSLLFS